MDGEVKKIDEEKKEKKITKGKIIVLSVSLTVCSALGMVAGWFVGSYFHLSEDINGSFEKDETSFNNMKTFLSGENKTTDDISTIDFTDSKILEKIDVGDIVGYSFYNFAYIEDHCSYVGFNKAVSTAVGVKNVQDVVSQYYKKDGYMTKENICKSSTGLVAYGERTFNYDSTQDVILKPKIYNSQKYDYYRDKTNVEFDEANKTCKSIYGKKVNSMSKPETYINILSSVPEFPFGYNITKDGVDHNSTLTSKDYNGNDMVFDNSIKLVDGNYVVNIKLNSLATSGLVNYMYTSTRDQSDLAKMKKPPTYNSIGCKVTLSKDLKVLDIYAIEDYAVYSNLATAATIGYNHIVFNYEEKAIPKLNESVINYGIAEAGL